MNNPADIQPADTWPCQSCGHKHYPSQPCADHEWTDSCPYEGLACRSKEERERRAAEIAVESMMQRPDVVARMPSRAELTLDDLLDEPED